MDFKKNIKIYLDSSQTRNYSFVFYIAFSLFCFGNLINYTTLDSFLFIPINYIQDFFSLLTLGFLFLKITTQKFSEPSLLIMLLISLPLLLSTVASDSKALIWIFLFVAASRDIKIKNVVKCALIICAFVFLFTFLNYCLGLIGGRSLDSGSRNSLGFNHPNRFGMVVLVICSSLAILFGNNHEKTILAAIFLSAILVWRVSASRTTILALFLLAVFVILSNKIHSESAKRRLCLVMIVMFLVYVAASFYFMVEFDPFDKTQSAINTFTSRRLYWSNYYYETYGISLFGVNYDNAPLFYAGSTDFPTHFLVDNSYTHILLRYGLFPATIFFVSVFFLFMTMYKRGIMNIEIMVFFLFCTVGIMENCMVDVSTNYMLISMGFLLNEKLSLISIKNKKYRVSSSIRFAQH